MMAPSKSSPALAKAELPSLQSGIPSPAHYFLSFMPTQKTSQAALALQSTMAMAMELQISSPALAQAVALMLKPSASLLWIYCFSSTAVNKPTQAASSSANH